MDRTPKQLTALQRGGKVIQSANTLDDLHAVCNRLHERWEAAGLHHDDAHGLAGVCWIKAKGLK